MTIRAVFLGAAIAALLVMGGSAQAYDASFDYNGDNAVDEADLDIIKGAFNSGEGDDNFVAACDHDGDGVITGADVAAAYAAAAAN